MDEFELIRTFWQNQAITREDVLIGIGDDAAVVKIPNQQSLAISSDAGLVDVHFFSDSKPDVIARRVFMRALSDLAAMGAKPAWFMQNLTLPSVDINWLQTYRDTLLQLASQYQMQLIGGDMSRGSLAIHLTVFGLLDNNKKLTRANAEVGDLIVVSGALGGACHYLDTRDVESQAYYNHPTARIELGLQLINIANACVDISDGLTQDLNHILIASNKGAMLDLTAIPRAKNATLLQALQGGDDYELCFTINSDKKNQLTQLSQQLQLPLTVIGKIEQQPGLRDTNADAIAIEGFKHYE